MKVHLVGVFCWTSHAYEKIEYTENFKNKIMESIGIW